MNADRKDDHVRLALAQRTSTANEFDDVCFVHHALSGGDRATVDLTVEVCGRRWPTPLFINAMTGGSAHTGEINRDLAIAARETGLPIAVGSMSAYLADPTRASSYSVIREENPDGVVLANINPNTTIADARRAVDLLSADALQVHLNAAQEIVMPEGDRSFGHWPTQLERLVAGVEVPLVVKEVGFGLSRETIAYLADLGVAAADVSGRGGTDFVAIERSRRHDGGGSAFVGWGLGTAAALAEGNAAALPLFASGGIRGPLDVARALALGAHAVGVSGPFLATLHESGVSGLIARIAAWLDELADVMTVLGASTPRKMTATDVLLTGALRSKCLDRGVDLGALAHRHVMVRKTTERTTR